MSTVTPALNLSSLHNKHQEPDKQFSQSNKQLLANLNTKDGSLSARSQSNRSGVGILPYEQDPASYFFPVLPYGFIDTVDLSGWVVQVGTKGSGRIERVFDLETQCDVIELISAPTNPLINYHNQGKANAALIPVPTNNPNQTAPFTTKSFTLTPRGTHAIVDAVTVKGNTGINAAHEVSLTQRLHGEELSQSKELSNAAIFGGSRATSEINTRGDSLQLNKNLPNSPQHHRRQSAQRQAQASTSPIRKSATSNLTTTLEKEEEAAALKRKQAVDIMSTSLEFPQTSQFIGTSLPILNIQLKNLNKYVGFEIEIEDTLGKLYRFDISNSCTIVRLRLDSANLPLMLTPGWNKLTLDLADLVKTSFNATFKQVHRIKFLASCRLRRVFFSDIVYPDFALPSFLRIFSENFYQAKRAEEVEAELSASNQLDPLDEESKTQSSASPSPPSQQRPSRLRDLLQQDLEAARLMEEELALKTLHAKNPLFEQRLLESQEERILRRHAETQASWAKFKQRTASKLGVPPTALNISRTDNFRAKQEELDLIDKSIPESEKNGSGREEFWSASLRGIGHSYIQVGNMFSGLFTRVTEKAPKVEVIRRPIDINGNEQQQTTLNHRTLKKEWTS